MRLVLMGPPGAGKGTQAKRLAERFKMTHLSSGDILRAERGSGSDLGVKLKSFMDRGALVPDDIVVSIMAAAVAAQASGLLLDGFPRTVPQAVSLDEQLNKLHRPLEAVLVIDTPATMLLERITGRRSCPQCGRVYHVKYLPVPADGLCETCQSKLVQRADDTAEAVSKRLDAYRRQTAPVIVYYTKAGRKVITVDGAASPDQVTARVVEALRVL